MTSVTKRRPSNITRQLRQSTHIVLARYANFPETIRARTTASNGDIRPLLWKGIGVVFLCAACVFSFFLVSNRHLFRREAPSTLADGQTQRVRYQHEPAGPPVQKGPPATATAAPYPTLTADGVEDDAPATPSAVDSLDSLPSSASVATIASLGPQDRKATGFVLLKTANFQSLGPVQLKLLRVDNKRGRYDLAMRMGGREFWRSDLRVNQQVTMKRTRLHLPDVVVNSISGNQISGYLLQANQLDNEARLAPISHRRHRAHHQRA